MIFTWRVQRGAIQQLATGDSTFSQSSLHTKSSSPLSLPLAATPELNLARYGLSQ